MIENISSVSISLFKMSDSDSDYIDVHEEAKSSDEDECVDSQDNNPRKPGVRGRDILWVELSRYADKASYEQSGFYEDIKTCFTLRKGRESEFSDSEHYTCKYARKRGFFACPLQYKIHFLSTSEEVVVLSNTRCHVHKEDLEYQRDGPNIHWTQQQTEIVMTGVKNEASAKVIKRNLQESNLFASGNFPTTSQLNAKIAYCRSIIRRTIEIFDTHQLREKIQEHLEIPDDELDSYIVYHHVDDENPNEDPHFCIIWTSKKLTARISSDLVQDDTTYI